MPTVQRIWSDVLSLWELCKSISVNNLRAFISRCAFFLGYGVRRGSSDKKAEDQAGTFTAAKITLPGHNVGTEDDLKRSSS